MLLTSDSVLAQLC